MTTELLLSINVNLQGRFLRESILKVNLDCGGITGWLKVAQLAKEYAIPVCSHGIQELHVSLVAAQPNSGWREVHSFPIDQYTKRPLVVENYRAIAPDIPGIGVGVELAEIRAF